MGVESYTAGMIIATVFSAFVPFWRVQIFASPSFIQAPEWMKLARFLDIVIQPTAQALSIVNMFEELLSQVALNGLCFYRITFSSILAVILFRVLYCDVSLFIVKGKRLVGWRDLIDHVEAESVRGHCHVAAVLYWTEHRLLVLF